MPCDWGNDITDGILRSFIEGWLQLLRYQNDHQMLEENVRMGQSRGWDIAN